MAQPSVRTIKRLFAASGNYCAFPGCEQALVDPDIGTVIGEVCYVRASSPEGLRYDPDQTDLVRHGFDNLVLMCPTHHKVIDENPETYMVERLLDIKAEHEAVHAGGSEPGDEVVKQLLVWIDTGGGAYVRGSVGVSEGGTFVGRDEIIHGDKVLGNKVVIGRIENSVVVLNAGNDLVKVLQPVSWADVRRACQQSSLHYLSQARGNVSALYIERADLRQEIDRFWKSDGSLNASYLVLNGESGMGKTFLLRKLEEDLRHQNNVACLFYDCGQLLAQIPEESELELFAYLARALLPVTDSRTIGSVLDQVEKVDGFSGGKRLVLIVDAINESAHMDRIVRTISQLQSPRHPWVKTIISCRPHVWRYLVEKGARGIPFKSFYKPTDANQRCIHVSMFGQAQANEAYQRYRHEFNFEPAEIDELPRSLQGRLYDPLRLALVSRIFRNARIDPEIIGSDVKVIPAYTKQILNDLISDLDPDDQDIRQRALDFLQKTLPQLMVEKQEQADGITYRCRNVVPRAKLGQVRRRDQIWFENFFKSGILVETRHDEIRFRFERFYDYYFGQHLKRLAEEGVILNCEEKDAETRPSS